MAGMPGSILGAGGSAVSKSFRLLVMRLFDIIAQNNIQIISCNQRVRNAYGISETEQRLVEWDINIKVISSH